MKSWIKKLAFVVGVPIVACAIYLGLQSMGRNFHEVIKGEYYRSAQMQPGDITHYAQKYHIKTVINLRGENTGRPWYDAEIREAKAASVNHIDFRMSSARELTQEQALQLIAVMRNAPKPLLVHCRGGADRTGLASAFYVAAIARKGEWAAERQLWLTYGHLPLWFISAYAMNRTFERLEPVFGYTDT